MDSVNRKPPLSAEAVRTVKTPPCDGDEHASRRYGLRRLIAILAQKRSVDGVGGRAVAARPSPELDSRP